MTTAPTEKFTTSRGSSSEPTAGYARRKHAVAVNSGTSGLHMLVRAFGIGEGDEVITTPFSFIASSNCILYE
ncbi:MAG: DegT/DnrJ/EryC1/StrS family aminotransferase, partial [Bacillota bacterium]